MRSRPSDILESRVVRGPASRRPGPGSDRCPARSSSASSATRRRARRRSRAGSCASSARTTVTHVCTRRLPPLRPPAARGARHHAAAPRLQLHRHHGPAPRATCARGEPILKPVYRHTGRHLRAAGVRRARTASRSSRACSATTRRRCATSTTCASSSPRRRSCGAAGRSQRDCSRRGYTTDQVLAELDRREPDSAAFIRPQERYADMVVSFLPGDAGPTPIISTPS